MDQRIIFTRSDGGLSIVVPAPNARRADESEQEFIDRLVLRRVPDQAPHRVVDTSELPPDRVFRNAWRDSGSGPVQVDMARARTIHLERIRSARDQALGDTDREWIEADSRDDTTAKAEIAARKQLLRDLPEQVDLERFETPEELAQYWPSELEGYPRNE